MDAITPSSIEIIPAGTLLLLPNECFHLVLEQYSLRNMDLEPCKTLFLGRKFAKKLNVSKNSYKGSLSLMVNDVCLFPDGNKHIIDYGPKYIFDGSSTSKYILV